MDRPAIPPGRPLDLALAMIAASITPVLLLDGNLATVAASESFCRAYDLDPAKSVGVAFESLGAGEWASRTLNGLLAAAVTGVDFDDYEFELKRPNRPALCLCLNARLLAYDHVEVRLLVAVIDITDVRANRLRRDELVNEKAVLLKELQHRVANSLQIIASVLMQSARRVSSEEARGHLRDAHNRVMSIAAVQRQLAEAQSTTVALKAYLDRLCASLAASMIGDPQKLSIVVTCDGGAVDPDTSVSMGLVVTELVINALKHGFADGRAGRIEVGDRSEGAGWALSVSDDGVGMPIAGAAPRSGLGTSIVNALARQLRATVSVEPANPGTRVIIAHRESAAANEDEMPLVAAV